MKIKNYLILITIIFFSNYKKTIMSADSSAAGAASSSMASLSTREESKSDSQSADYDQVRVVINLVIKKKINSEDVQKILDEVKTLMQESLTDPYIGEHMRKWYKESIKKIKMGDVKPAFDLLIKRDKNGSNINNLIVILETGKIDLNQKCMPSNVYPLYWAVHCENYPLFELLFNNGAIVTKEIEDFLYSQLRFSIKQANTWKNGASMEAIELAKNYENEVFQLKKMIRLSNS